MEVFRCLSVPSAPRNAWCVILGGWLLWKGNSAALFTAELPTDIELQSPPRSRHTHTPCLTQLPRPEKSQRSTRWRCSDASQYCQRRELRFGIVSGGSCGAVFFFRAVRLYSSLFSSDSTLKSSLVEQTDAGRRTPYILFFRHRALLRDGMVLIRNSLRSNNDDRGETSFLWCCCDL